MNLTESQYCFFRQDSTSVNTWTNVQNIFSLKFPFGDRVWFWKYCHYDIDLNRYFFSSSYSDQLACFFSPNRMRSHVYFNFCVKLAELWHVFVKWTYILETTMHRFPSIRQTVSSNFLNIFLTYSLIYSPSHRNVI
jgi:hypothetical protein